MKYGEVEDQTRVFLTTGVIVEFWCNTAWRGLIGHQLATAWVEVLRLCFTDD